MHGNGKAHKDATFEPFDRRAYQTQMRSAERDAPPPPVDKHAHEDPLRRPPNDRRLSQVTR